MTKRTKVVTAIVTFLLSVTVLATALIQPTQLEAFSLNATGVNYAKVFIWVGVALLGLSALFFVSASTE